MREMRAIAFVSRLINEGKISDKAMKRMLIHSIADEDFMQRLSANSKLNADWEFLVHLRDVGRAKAASWLEENFANLGKRSSTDFSLYL
jgi:NTE family protein